MFGHRATGVAAGTRGKEGIAEGQTKETFSYAAKTQRSLGEDFCRWAIVARIGDA